MAQVQPGTQPDTSQFVQNVLASKDERERVRALVAQKRWTEAEPNRDRLADYVSRRASIMLPTAAESKIGETFDWLAASFLPAGSQARRAVASIIVSDGRSASAGTGFLISPELFITNNHVVADEQAARGAQVTFDYERDDQGRPRPTTTYLLNPARFALFSPFNKLDYALVALGQRNAGNATPAEFGYLPLSNRPDRHAIGMFVNIVQHPGGWPRMIALRNNLLVARTPRTLLYETDTDHGSSGAPVFNDDWEVVALHHWGEPFLEHTDDTGKTIPTTVNEGVRISAIFEDLETQLKGLSGEKRDLLETALAFTRKIDEGRAKRLSPPRASPQSGAEKQTVSLISSASNPIVSPAREAPRARDSMTQEIRISLPLEIAIRLGDGAQAQHVENRSTVAPIEPAKTLLRGAEKLPLDPDYSNRSGYKPKFIKGFEISLPEPNAKLRKQVGALRAGEPDMEKGILIYEHFSIVMNRTKRMAMFSATNIDGNAYIDIDRRTGLPKDAAEAEKWFIDPRISASFYLDNTFYGAWSAFFDHGHLTRRMDPNWGNDETAARANADTYHFTNCTPQHFRFNETARLWQGAEQYVLETGALAPDTLNRISVFQGPIFNDQNDRWADDVQIPSEFFKVIAWKGKSGPKSVALVVDQSKLLDEERKALGQPKPLDHVSVNQWRVPIATVESKSGLDFGEEVRACDTIKDEEQPTIGEAAMLITSREDLLPRKTVAKGASK